LEVVSDNEISTYFVTRFKRFGFIIMQIHGPLVKTDQHDEQVDIRTTDAYKYLFRMSTGEILQFLIHIHSLFEQGVKHVQCTLTCISEVTIIDAFNINHMLIRMNNWL